MHCVNTLLGCSLDILLAVVYKKCISGVKVKTLEQQIENLRIINLLKENLSIPFLFLAGGECRIVRRMGGAFGCCMYLCTPESPAPATLSQPPLRDVKLIRDLI